MILTLALVQVEAIHLILDTHTYTRVAFTTEKKTLRLWNKQDRLVNSFALKCWAPLEMIRPYNHLWF